MDSDIENLKNKLAIQSKALRVIAGYGTKYQRMPMKTLIKVAQDALKECEKVNSK